MVIMEGSSPFYACPHYMRKDEKHPDGYEEGENACANRISFTAASTVMEKFMRIVEEDAMSGAMCDYRGMKFDHNGITVKILKYAPNDVQVGILNRKALKS